MLPFMVGIAVTANAESVEINGLYYELDTSSRTAKLTYQTTGTDNYASLSANVSVPGTVTYNNVSFIVTEIADRAFANCTSLESISIPASVTTIGTTVYNNTASLPFYNCTSLKNVRFEDGDTDLYLGASCYIYNNDSYPKGLFYSCPLEEVYIGRNINYQNLNYYGGVYTHAGEARYYGYSAFYNQSKLSKVTIGEKVTKLPQYAFYNCSAIEDVSFGNALISIEKYTFNGCRSLKTAMLPETVTYIGEYAFYDCSNGKSQCEVCNSYRGLCILQLFQNE